MVQSEHPVFYDSSGRRRRRFALAALAFLLLLLLAMLPLIRGTETLILRDVLNSHFPMKWSQAVALRHGYFPLIDPYRAGFTRDDLLRAVHRPARAGHADLRKC